MNAAQKKYRQSEKGKKVFKAIRQRWMAKHREQQLAKQRARYHRDVQYRLSIVLRNRLNMALKKKVRSGSAIRDLGCSVQEFVEYIAKKFLPGMSWETWGEWHLDHIRPVSSFDLTKPSELRAAFHYTNYQPLWKVDNLRKGAKEVSHSYQL